MILGSLVTLTIYTALLESILCSPTYRFPEKLVSSPSLLNSSIDPFNGYVCYDIVGCFYRNGTFSHLKYLPASPESIATRFLLFTRQDPVTPHELKYDDETTVMTVKLDTSRPFKFMVHGFTQGVNSGPIQNIKNGLLEEEDINMVIVDWYNGARPPNYVAAAVNTELVGRQLALLIKMMVTSRKVDPESIHLIGFSLGSHISGFAGKWLRDQFDIGISRITGLDPASPFFESHGPSVHLWKADAKFVDIIHTSGGSNYIKGEFGFHEAIGHVDFYPNGGNNQPRCEEGNFKCNHQSALAYFVESFKKTCDFAAYPCSAGFESYERGHCFMCVWQFPCGNMGYYSDQSAGRGTLYLSTSANPPFCGVDISVLVQTSRHQEKVVGSIILNLIGEQANGSIEVTRIPNSDLLPGNELVRVQSLSEKVFPLVSVEIKYVGYKGWGIIGFGAQWLINAIHIVNEERNHEFHYCGVDTVLAHDTPLVLKQGGCGIFNRLAMSN